MLTRLKNQAQKLSNASKLLEAIELVEEHIDSDFVFDGCKAVMESIYKVILQDRGISFSPGDDFPKLTKLAVSEVIQPLTPKEAEPVKKMCNGVTQTMVGLCELRNSFGPISHGKDAGSLESFDDLRGYVLSQTDAVGSFLLKSHLSSQSPASAKRLHYENQSDFNDWIDQVYDIVRIGDANYTTSEVLYKVDPDLYREWLIDFNEQPKVE